MRKKNASEKSKKIKYSGGFTLIEAIVSIAVVLILSGSLLAYNHSTDEQVVLFKDRAVLIGVLNRAKALSQQRLNAQDTCAFGLHISSIRDFLIFGDKKIDETKPCVSDNGIPNSDMVYNSGEEIITLPDGSLEKNIFILNPEMKFNTDVVNQDIVFIPPDVFVTSTLPLPVSIIISNADGSKSATTDVSFGGQIVTK